MYAGRVPCCPWWVTVSMPTGQTDWRTDGRQTVTLRFPLDAASLKTMCDDWNAEKASRVVERRSCGQVTAARRTRCWRVTSVTRRQAVTSSVTAWRRRWRRVTSTPLTAAGWGPSTTPAFPPRPSWCSRTVRRRRRPLAGGWPPTHAATCTRTTSTRTTSWPVLSTLGRFSTHHCLTCVSRQPHRYMLTNTCPSWPQQRKNDEYRLESELTTKLSRN